MDYRDSQGEQRTPPFPSRVRNFVYACAVCAHEDSVEEAGGKVAQRTGGMG